MDLISVIVPVYNVEKYLSKCLDSIISQTYKNLEIILVDDGSTDKSGSICDYYANMDKRVKVIHQSNKGGGAARNVALDLAVGDFITFVDSDDYISPKMFEYLHKQFAEDIDIVECEYSEVYDEDFRFSFEYDKFIAKTYTVLEAMKNHIMDINFKQVIYNKMYRKETMHNCRLPEGKKIDDEYFTYKVLGNAKKLIHINIPLYAYRQQELSIMHSMGVINRLQAIEAKCFRHKYICENFSELAYFSLKNLWFTCLYLGQLLLRNKEIKNSKFYINEIKQVFELYPFTNELEKELSGKEKVWIKFMKISFLTTCKIRNFLRIGV